MFDERTLRGPTTKTGENVFESSREETLNDKKGGKRRWEGHMERVNNKKRTFRRSK